MVDSTPAAGDFDNKEGPSKKKTKYESAGDLSGSLPNVCPGYIDEVKFSLTFSLDSLNEKPKTEKVLVGNHLKWYLCAEKRTNKGEECLAAFLFNEDWYKYPMSYDLEYTLEAKSATCRIVRKKSVTYGETNYELFCGWMTTYDSLSLNRHIYAVDGKHTVTATLKIRMPMFYNFNSADSLSDVVIKIAQKSFPINKSFLAVHSNYFRAMFFGQFAEAKQDEVILNDVDPYAFVLIINLLFVRSFKLKMNSVASVLQLADHFGMSSILSHCEELLMVLSIDKKPSVGERLVLANEYSLNNLQKRCLDLCDSAFPSRW